MSRKEMIEAIQECARKLGHVPSQTEARKMKGITVPMIRRNFGTYTQLMGECKLKGRRQGQKLETEMLLRGWATVVRKLKKLPSVATYEHLSNYTETPFRVRFGGWKKVPQGFKRYALEKGWTEEWKDVLEIIEREEQATAETAWMFNKSKSTEPVEKRVEIAARQDRPVYGEAIRPCPMAFGPTNEAGVIYLFGTMAEQLGFIVTRVQTAFPDCEGMRRVEGNRWQPVSIEFEYESRNFLKHGHNAKKCDLIVCWAHNWNECPVEVVELRKLLP
jgi:Homing endonuclease associated repeat